jgi:RNA polymerase sigma-70 factor, ECF subfamily
MNEGHELDEFEAQRRLALGARELAHAQDELSDDAVIARVLHGETPLFEVLMRRNNQRLFRAARSLLRNDDEAEDVMQEAYLQAFANLHRFERRAKFSTWLTRIAVHEAFARLRRRRPMLDPENEDVSSPMPSPEDSASQRELGGVLEPMVDALPEAFRIVFVLRAVEALSVGETADCLGVPEETVRTRFFRARRLLQTALEERLLSPGVSIYEFHLLRCDRVVHGVLARIAAGG